MPDTAPGAHRGEPGADPATSLRDSVPIPRAARRTAGAPAQRRRGRHGLRLRSLLGRRAACAISGSEPASSISTWSSTAISRPSPCASPRSLGSRLHSHPQFMTAELLAPGGLRIDLARARSESYRRAGEPASGRAGLAGERSRASRLHGQLPRDSARTRFRRAPDRSLRRARGPLAAAPADAASRLVPGRPDADPARRRVRGPVRLRFRPGDQASRPSAPSRPAPSPCCRRRAWARRCGGPSAGPRAPAGVLRRLRDAGWLPAICAIPAAGGGASGADTAARSFDAPERFDAAVRARPTPIPRPARAGGGGQRRAFRLALLCLGLDLDGGGARRGSSGGSP